MKKPKVSTGTSLFLVAVAAFWAGYSERAVGESDKGVAPELPVAAVEDVQVSGVEEGAARSKGVARGSSGESSELYSVRLRTIDGAPTSLQAHAGKALLIVNVASRCGLTPQYAGLEELYRRYADRGFAVLGFPCNQFGGQEPGDAAEIKRFCSLEYDVTFPMYEKIEVNGAERNPLYQLLSEVSDATGYSGDIRWNFEKFVVAADGRTIHRFAPTTKPDDSAVIAAIEASLPPG